MIPDGISEGSTNLLDPRWISEGSYRAHSPIPKPSTTPSAVVTVAENLAEKRTNEDLRAHPLTTELQNCNSPSKILAVLHQGLDQSLRSDDRWTKWFNPTVNILYMLSMTFGEGIGLVSFKIWTEICSLMFI